MNQNWNLIGIPERILSCRIPERLLKHMSDEQFPNQMPGEEEFHNEILSILILYQEKFQEELTEEDRKFVEAFSNITSE